MKAKFKAQNYQTMSMSWLCIFILQLIWWIKVGVIWLILTANCSVCHFYRSADLCPLVFRGFLTCWWLGNVTEASRLGISTLLLNSTYLKGVSHRFIIRLLLLCRRPEPKISIAGVQGWQQRKDPNPNSRGSRMISVVYLNRKAYRQAQVGRQVLGLVQVQVAEAWMQ